MTDTTKTQEAPGESPNTCPTCGKVLGSMGDPHSHVPTTINAKGQTVYMRTTDPTQNENYCDLCCKVHRHIGRGSAIICVWEQAELHFGKQLPCDATSFEEISALLVNGDIAKPGAKR